MSVEGLEDYSKNDLIEELINRQTFVGLVIFHMEDAKDGQLTPGEIVMTKSPPLSRDGVERLLQVGHSLLPSMFSEQSESSIAVHSDVSPLRLDPGGILRVGQSRVSLDLVIEHYQDGSTPEEIVQAYDTLVVSDVYAVIGYYLRHRQEIDEYMNQREASAAKLRALIEESAPRISLAELQARRNSQEKLNATAGQ